MTWKNCILLDKTKLVGKEKYAQYPNIVRKCMYVCLCVRISKIIRRNIYK